MSVTRFTVELKTKKRFAPALLEKVLAAVNEFEDSVRCPSLSRGGEERCELDVSHSEERHKNGTLSWPNTELLDGIERATGAYVVMTMRPPHTVDAFRMRITEVTDTTVTLKHDQHVESAVVNRAGFWDRYRLA